ncbi:TetR family transcriptional regulator [Tsukamurella pulmonis]|uniref:DNA-binding transcriptional regulator, AcrR family n=1 Tax=Tsukamurella pulmonis TaxID=47312 RepID=A0A1H1F6Z5_9ACTN|nr:TetR/AcrR family transcriptional regulator [Tsukamurella pulmonis]KXO88648.1 TetR family transcriptional regulator [Tsukamurella pulmonis]SDQ96680.1 DNA-binding transcriptional regulator, AcrR family [Tsukamurella pulmonis]SUP19994.1 transcriptional regulator BetI [Tsukamurella pulmonis]
MPYVESAVRGPQIVAAARAVLIRDGVAKTSLRAVASEAGIPLGTLQHVFPGKQLLLQAVIEQVIDDISEVLRRSADTDAGLAHALAQGLRNFWATLVLDHRGLQVLQYELVTHALRTPGLEDLARLQYERYAEVVRQWCVEAADRAEEDSAVPYDRLARVVVAAVDGLILQQVSAPDADRAAADLEAVIAMVIALAAPAPR